MRAVSADSTWMPKAQELERNLNRLRRMLDHKLPRLTRINELVRVAQLLRPASSDDLDGVLAVVRLAIDHLPRDHRAGVARLLYGLTKDSKGLPLNKRRELAYHRFLEVAPDIKPGFKEVSFRTGFEKELAEDLATALVELVVKHHECPALDPNAAEVPQAPNDGDTIDPTDQVAAGDQQADVPEHEAQQEDRLGASGDGQPIAPVETLPKPLPDPAPQRRHRTWDAAFNFPHPRVRVLIGVGIAALVGAVLLIVKATSGAGATSGRCGAPAAQFPRGLTSNIAFYAPSVSNTLERWSGGATEQRETVRYGAVRLIALQAANSTLETEHNLIARIGLPPSATLESDTTCVYRNDNYMRGTRFAGSSLISSDGVRIGSLAPKQTVYVTFKERLPTVGRPGNVATTYGAIAPESEIDGPEWTADNASRLEIELTGGK